ncbi:penicillin-binding protein activator LpoB, partial [candidate division KSB1 bacterium]|nr:penicillin-binding protein activator LpoB [candidate division KSB1 bacterium]
MKSQFRIAVVLIFLIFILTTVSTAREKIAIAVLDFEAKNVNQQNAEAVADLLRTELFNTGSFK